MTDIVLDLHTPQIALIRVKVVLTLKVTSEGKMIETHNTNDYRLQEVSSLRLSPSSVKQN